MANFEIRLNDETTDSIDKADSYLQEGTMTTFFQFREGADNIDSWSRRLASYRTSSIVSIRESKDDNKVIG